MAKVDSIPKSKAVKRKLSTKGKPIKRVKKSFMSDEMTKTAKSLWLSNFKQLKKEERSKIVLKVLKELKGKLIESSRRSEFSRAIEICLKHGMHSAAEVLFDELQNDLIEIACDKYGKFVVLSLIKNCDRKIKNKIEAIFYKNAYKLAVHRYGSVVFDLIYRTNPGRNFIFIASLIYPPAILPEIDSIEAKSIKSLMDTEKSVKKSLYKNVKKISKKLIEKEMLTTAFSHHLLLEFSKNCSLKRKLNLTEKLVEFPLLLAQSKLGCHLAVFVFTFCSTKQKKSFIKKICTNVEEMAKDTSGWLILSRCLEITDDTVFLNKTITKALKNLLTKEKSSCFKFKSVLKLFLRLLNTQNSSQYCSPIERSALFKIPILTENDQKIEILTKNNEKTNIKNEQKSEKRRKNGEKDEKVKNSINYENWLNKKEIEKIKSFTKKDGLKRREEILKILLPDLVKIMTDDFEIIAKNTLGKDLLFQIAKQQIESQIFAEWPKFIESASKAIFNSKNYSNNSVIFFATSLLKFHTKNSPNFDEKLTKNEKIDEKLTKNAKIDEKLTKNEKNDENLTKKWLFVFLKEANKKFENIEEMKKWLKSKSIFVAIAILNYPIFGEKINKNCQNLAKNGKIEKKIDKNGKNCQNDLLKLKLQFVSLLKRIDLKSDTKGKSQEILKSIIDQYD